MHERKRHGSIRARHPNEEPSLFRTKKPLLKSRLDTRRNIRKTLWLSIACIFVYLSCMLYLTGYVDDIAKRKGIHFGSDHDNSSKYGKDIDRNHLSPIQDHHKTAATSIHPSFHIIEQQEVEEYGAHCTTYRHKKTGAELLSVQTDDNNKVFGITFRTPPIDSTGVAHILEHSVLCGSKKYTTKSPFSQLRQQSLNTFLNAMTYPDRTCYVLASQNLKDFYNMVNVYTDAVFHPRAAHDPMVHAQEGWHFEIDSKDQPLIYKGVVYNEMKGVYSSPEQLISRISQHAMFPNNTYGVSSGGDPIAIPDLSFEDFVGFHSKFYHPGNSRIFFWGDDDVKRRLDTMDEYLEEFDESPGSKLGSTIQWQKKIINKPEWIKSPYPIGSGQPEEHMIMVSWLVNDHPFTSLEKLAIGVLDLLLMGTSQSVLYKAVIESGLGTQVIGEGLEEGLLQTTFSVGLRGVKPENSKSVEVLVLNTLKSVMTHGFIDDDIASAMNTIEFELREFNTGSSPKGLSFMLEAMSEWIYDRSPTASLRFERPLAELKDRITKERSKIFTELVREYLVENTHRVTIEMVPSRTLEKEKEKEEADRLAGIKAALSVTELEKLIQDTSNLRKFQAAKDTQEDQDTIPSLQLADLKRTVTEYPTKVTENESGSGVSILRHELPSTSGIFYVTFAVDVSKIAFEDVHMLSLFNMLMTKTGAGKYSDDELLRKIGMDTGGIGVNLSIKTLRPESVEEGTVHSCDHMLTKIMIQGKATSEKADNLFSLFNLVLTKANLDSQKKAIEWLKMTKSRLESNIQGSGHIYSNKRMKSHYSVPAYISEKLSGITYLSTVKTLLNDAEKHWSSILRRLENIREIILHDDTTRNGMLLDITGDSVVLAAIQPAVESFLTNLMGNPSGSKLQEFYSIPHPWAIAAKAEMSMKNSLINEGFVVSTQVSFVGKAFRIYEEGEKINGSSAVVAHYLRTGYLWDKVRVMGGAYGAMCTFDSKASDGVFTFISYRDPNLNETLAVYDGAGEALLASVEELANDNKKLTNAIIGTVGEMDSVLSPDQKGRIALHRWLSRETPEQRLAYRESVLNTKARDFKEFAMRLKAANKSSTVILSSSSAFELAAPIENSIEIKNIV